MAGQTSVNPREQLEEADRLRQQGKLDRAESICSALVRRNPGYLAAIHTLGLVYLDKGNFERALDCLVRASMMDPANWMTLTGLSLAYLRLGATEMAAQTLERALAVRPNDASIFASLGEIHREEREHEAARQAYQRALALDPDLESAAIGLALCLQALGRAADAANVLGDAYNRGHRSLNLLHVMTTLPPNTLSVDVLAALDRLALNQNWSDANLKNSFSFARAAALANAGRHAEAWQTLVTANRFMAAAHQPALKANILRREKSLAWLRGAKLKPIDGSGGPITLFILGPSRSGKTSLERLIGTLDGTRMGGEVPIVEKAVRRAFDAAALPPGNHLEDLPAKLLPDFRGKYLEGLAQRVGSARLFTTTLPGRIYDAGLIAMAVPNVRFVLLKRNVDDMAWKIYLTKYLTGNSYAYSLKDIRDYLDWYHAMIDLTAEKLPDIARVLSYEALIDDPGAALRGVAELCGLDPHERPVLSIDHDRGCGAPYREFMARDS